MRELVYRAAGIFHPDNKLKLLQERCGRRMKELRVETLHEYFACLTSGSKRHAELVALLNEITIGETCFFRNLPQVEALRRIVIPKIVEARLRLSTLHSANRGLRMWSAGCSTGEEPYTVRMVLHEDEGD